MTDNFIPDFCGGVKKNFSTFFTKKDDAGTYLFVTRYVGQKIRWLIAGEEHSLENRGCNGQVPY